MPTPTYNWGTPDYTDSALSTAARTGLPVLSSPIPGVATEYLLSEKWMQARKNFSPLALNTIHPEFKVANNYERDFFLVEETERQDAGTGLVTWDKLYAAVPVMHDEFETASYNFIGFYGAYGINTYSVTGRERFTESVMSRVRHTYYLVGSGQTYTTPGAIPVVDAQRYWANATFYLPTDFLGDLAIIGIDTSPTRTAYNAMVADAVTNKWSATTGQIVAEGSRLSRWHGNIWKTETRYVLAK